jgi:hypothetical protein
MAMGVSNDQFLPSCHPNPISLKQEFNIVKQLCGLSGFGWDDERKIVMTSPEVWDRYLKVSLPSLLFHVNLIPSQKHLKAKPWCRKAFPLYNDILDLIDGTRVTGDSAFWWPCIADENIDPVLLENKNEAIPSSSSASMAIVVSDYFNL